MIRKLLNKLSGLSFENVSTLIGALAFILVLLGSSLIFCALALVIYLVNNSSL